MPCLCTPRSSAASCGGKAARRPGALQRMFSRKRPCQRQQRPKYCVEATQWQRWELHSSVLAQVETHALWWFVTISLIATCWRQQALQLSPLGIFRLPLCLHWGAGCPAAGRLTAQDLWAVLRSHQTHTH